jgi:protein SCO1/2
MTSPALVPPILVTRRRVLQLGAGGFGLALLGGCGPASSWHGIDVSGSSPPLAFTMARTPDGKQVSEVDYRGQIVMLYLGYTFCPDVCPTTLANVAGILQKLGGEAARVTFLFVTVDPKRDTLPVLADYVANFSPRMVGLRGTDDQLAALARRYRLVYSVTPAAPGQAYEVTHSAAIYVFDGSGAARLLIPDLAAAGASMEGTATDLKRLIAA